MSLDVESLWGSVLHPKSKESRLLMKDETKGRRDIYTLLSMCEKYNIPATWAIVGHLFLEECLKEKVIPHYGIPPYKDDWYSCDPCSNLFYGKDIIEKIIASPVEHEIGYHSFSNVPFSECLRAIAGAEIDAGLEAAAKLGITLESFVFPENKNGNLDVLKEKGFKIYRGLDPGTFTTQSSQVSMFIKALNRVLPYLAESKWMDGIWEISGSNLIVTNPRYLPLVSIAKAGITHAIEAIAKDGED